jgi:hypothetical protein
LTDALIALGRWQLAENNKDSGVHRFRAWSIDMKTDDFPNPLKQETIFKQNF